MKRSDFLILQSSIATLKERSENLEVQLKSLNESLINTQNRNEQLERSNRLILNVAIPVSVGLCVTAIGEGFVIWVLSRR